MRRRERPTRFGWRWRRNKLRRPVDVVESWLVLLSLGLLCLTPLLGWWAGMSVDRGLQRMAREERADRTLVTATVAPGSSEQGGHSGGGDEDVLRWTSPGGHVHSTPVPSDLRTWDQDKARGEGQDKGQDKVKVWIDAKGELVPAPLDPSTVSTHAALAGIAAASGGAGLVLISRQLVMWRLMRRRIASWEREWARIGQYWGRMGAGG